MVFLGRKTKNLNYIMLIAATALFFISSVFTQAQVAKDAWVLGFGLTGGRVSFSASGLGAYASIQRNFSEHSGLRLSTNFGSSRGRPAPDIMTSTFSSTDVFIKGS